MINIMSDKNASALETGKSLLVGYLLAGYPEKEDFLKLISKCETRGIDIFEIGFPSKDPCKDGEIIRNAHLMVDDSVRWEESYWSDIRKAVKQPIWVMGYKSDLIESGFYKMLARKQLIDALVIPDMSFDEHQELALEVAPHKVDVVGFVNPEMNDAELEKCFANTALVYQQLYSGPTGMTVIADDFEETIKKASRHKHVKVFAGFGINTPQRAAQLLNKGFDGVIVGTAMIKNLNHSEQQLLKFVHDLAVAAREVV